MNIENVSCSRLYNRLWNRLYNRLLSVNGLYDCQDCHFGMHVTDLGRTVGRPIHYAAAARPR